MIQVCCPGALVPSCTVVIKPRRGAPSAPGRPFAILVCRGDPPPPLTLPVSHLSLRSLDEAEPIP